MSRHKRVAFYARVSTGGQTVENQMRELRGAAERHGWLIVADFADHAISGAKGRKDRPQLDAMLKGVARREFELVASWSLDRLGRSTLDVLNILQDVRAKNVDLYLHQQALDTSTPAGRAMFGMLGIFAELEREFIREQSKVSSAPPSGDLCIPIDSCHSATRIAWAKANCRRQGARS
jgi:DNA invertase Pin-like site-specific DNA recombinase